MSGTNGRLKGKAALVTGGAQGIGRAICDRFAAEGADVAVLDVGDGRAAAAASEIARAAGVRALGLSGDVTDYAACEAAVKAVTDAFGKIDILVNNAGITRDNLLMRLSEQDWDLVMGVNLKGAFHCTKAASRPMLKSHSGRIVNIASVVGQEGNAGQANYAASKGGLIAFTKSCAKEFASRNILVNAVAPGFIHTRLTDVISEEAKKRTLERILLGRMGEPAEVASVVAFLASDDAGYVTGQVIGVNGGMYL